MWLSWQIDGILMRRNLGHILLELRRILLVCYAHSYIAWVVSMQLVSVGQMCPSSLTCQPNCAKVRVHKDTGVLLSGLVGRLLMPWVVPMGKTCTCGTRLALIFAICCMACQLRCSTFYIGLQICLSGAAFSGCHAGKSALFKSHSQDLCGLG